MWMNTFKIQAYPHTHSLLSSSVSDESQAGDLCGNRFINAGHLNSSRLYWERAGTIKENEDGFFSPNQHYM